MTVTLVRSPNSYVGVSSDTKPTTDVPPGSRFLERDTGTEFVWDGTAWGQIETSAAAITNVASGTADVDAALAAATGLRLLGFAIKESTAVAAVAELSLVHGATVTGGTAIDGFHFDLAANGEVREWFGPDGIAIPNGLSVDRIVGSTKLTLFHRTAT